MSINEIIARLVEFRAQYGDLPVLVEQGFPPMTLTVQDDFSLCRKPSDKPTKVVMIG